LPRRKEIGEGKGFLFVDSEPSGVDVYLDGRLIGKTPIWQEIVSVGRHRLELRSETHANLSEEIEVEDASVVRKSYRLKPAFGNLVVFTDIPDAKVRVGGQEVPLRDGRGEVRLPGGDYEVVVSWGQWQLRRKVVVLKERTVEEYFRARDCVGHLTILSDEPIKGLTVNGVKMDVEVPLTLKNLPVGEYVVRSLREVGEICEIWEGSARVTAGRTEILRLTKRTMKIALKHGNGNTCVSFSPDGKFLVSGGDDKTVKVWAVGSWREVATLKGHGGYVYSVSFSPDGKFLASGSGDATVKVWAVGSWREVTTLRGHRGKVFSVIFSPDGKFLASGSGDATVKVWEVGSWREVTILKGHGKDVYSVSFSPDGRFLASGSRDKTVKVWEVGSWREVTTLRHGDPVYSVSFSPDGRFLASASWNKTVKVWEVGRWQEVATLKGHGYSDTSVAFSPDGKFLVSESGELKVWEVGSWREVTILKGHVGWVNSLSFSPDGKFLASGGSDGTIRLWAIEIFLSQR
jgi:tricorn protease-like protein